MSLVGGEFGGVWFFPAKALEEEEERRGGVDVVKVKRKTFLISIFLFFSCSSSE